MGKNFAEGLQQVSGGIKNLNQTMSIHSITGGQAWDPQSAALWSLQKTADHNQMLQDLLGDKYKAETAKEQAYADWLNRSAGKSGGGGSGDVSVEYLDITDPVTNKKSTIAVPRKVSPDKVGQPLPGDATRLQGAPTGISAAIGNVINAFGGGGGTAPSTASGVIPIRRIK